MKIFHTERHAGHDPQFFLVRGRPTAAAEQPERARILLTAARAGGHDIAEAPDQGLGPIADVHTPEYLDFLQVAWAQWQALPGASAEVIPNVHPGRAGGHYPTGIVGRAGWHTTDTGSPIGPATWEAAYHAAQVAVAAADHVLATRSAAYALCRPPGHHAFADTAGGFCFLNNTAIAARRLRAVHGRVAVLDIDVHHGNGTQGIFYADRDVLTVSLHTDPNGFYPYFWGHAHERGQGAGEGFNLNLPLPAGSGDAPWLAAGRVALERIGRFAPGALVVALGLDAAESDPLQGLRITTEGFRQMAAAIAGLGLPTVLVQEGGYLGPELGINLAAFLAAFESAHSPRKG
ncbi:MAG: histone deacetylase family protein [Betaproteobacteria bacterium]|nr:histone deacetylase family protein [Betaproteobacteria bacterium]